MDQSITEKGPWWVKVGKKEGDETADLQVQLEQNNDLAKKPRLKKACSKLADGSDAEEWSAE